MGKSHAGSYSRKTIEEIYMFENAIKESKALSQFKEKDERPVFHAAFSGTSNYLIHTGVTMVSMLESNPDFRISFHLFVNGLEDIDRQRMEEVGGKYGCQIKVYFINDDVFKDMLHSDGIAAFFYRFIIPPSLHKEGVKRFVYLDGDIMCQGSVRELYELDMKGKTAACVIDTNPEFAENRRKGIGTKQYFNSGFMYIDVEKWMAAHLSDQCGQMALDRKKSGKQLHTHDQDILNILLNDSVLLLPWKYNHIYNMDLKGLFHKQVEMKYHEDDIFIHFAGIVKPWRSWVQELPGVKVYRKYWLASPWRDVGMVGFKRSKDIHHAARNERRLGHYGKMLHYYLMYLGAKFGK